MPVHRTSDNRNRSAPTKNATGELPLNATRSISCVRRRRSMASVVISCLAEPHFKSVIGLLAERASGSLWKMGVGILIEGGDPLKGVGSSDRLHQVIICRYRHWRSDLVNTWLPATMLWCCARRYIGVKYIVQVLQPEISPLSSEKSESPLHLVGAQEPRSSHRVAGSAWLRPLRNLTIGPPRFHRSSVLL
jgi:hypothetical protein